MAEEKGKEQKNQIEQNYEKHAIQFNQKPEKAIEDMVKVCVDNGLVPSKTIAKFFIDQKSNLNLKKMGEFLSEDGKDPKFKLNADVLKEFTNSFDFKDIDFLPAMRDHVKAYKLPGEAQKIDRLMESFANRYHEQNPGLGINSSDAGYTLAYATMMLNTSSHNSNIKDSERMTSEQFANLVEDVNVAVYFQEKIREGVKKYVKEEIKVSFPKELLSEIYNDIKKTPFEFNFSESTPQYKFDESNLKKDEVYKILSKKNLKVEDIKKACPLIKNKDIFFQQSSYKENKTKEGATSKITLTDVKTKEEVTIKIFKPSLRSKLTSNQKESITIIPSKLNPDDPAKSFDFAAQIAAGINSSCEISGKYDYEKKYMPEALRTQIAASSPKQSVEEEKSNSIKDDAKSETEKNSTKNKINGKTKEKAKKLKPSAALTSAVSKGVKAIRKKFPGKSR